MHSSAGRWFSPLNLAAYITWLAVLLQLLTSLPSPLAGRPLLGLLALALMVVLFTLVSATEAEWLTQARRRALVVTQAGLVLLAIWATGRGNAAILLIIVAAQAMALWPWRSALMLMLLANLGLFALWQPLIGTSRTLLELLPVAGFQAFAALMSHFAASAEAAKADLELRNGELEATRQLLADSTRAEERLRLSRELHDVAGHKLTALKLNLRLLERDAGASESLQTCQQLADELLGDIRQVVSALRRHDGIDLAAALRLLVEVIPGVQWQLELQPELRVDRVSVAEVLLRGAQEAITNALRHGQARAIQLRLWQARGAVQLSVAHGGAVVPVLHEGNGLTGMRERVQAIGGALALERPASGGLTVRLSVPVDAPTGGMA